MLILVAGQYSVSQTNTRINEIQKQIGQKKKNKENADELMAQKVELEKEKKTQIESAAAKEVTLKKKIGTIGNIVHDSVPVNNDEVFGTRSRKLDFSNRVRITMVSCGNGHLKESRSRSAMSSHITRY